MGETTTHDRLLTWFGAEDYARQLDQVRRFWAGEGRYVVSLQTSAHPYRQAFDEADMCRAAAAQLEAQAALPGMNLPSLFADFGTISVARYWGGRVVPPKAGAMIYIEPAAQSVAEALELTPRPVDDPDMDAARALRLFDQVGRELGTDALWLRTPDMQGVLNTAGLIVNQEELLMAMYDEPDAVHRLLDRVCDFLIEFARYLCAQSDDRVCGNIWPYTFMPGEFGVSLTEDLMPLLPPDLYREFGIPYLKRIDEALGGLHIHCCGAWGRHAQALAEAGLTMRAVECHYPATPITDLAALPAGTVLVPYLIDHKQNDFASLTDYWRWLLDNAPATTRFWFAAPTDTDEFRAFVKTYGAFG